MKNLLILITICFVSFSYSQSIRKDYREFTQQEINDYRAAVNILYNNGTMLELANHHGTHFNSIIHTNTTAGFNGEQFLTWHRFNMLDFETLLKNTNSNYNYLSLPFWDWTTDRTSSAAKFWNNDFLAISNFPNSGVSRNIGSNGFLGSVSDINNALTLSIHFSNGNSSAASADFSHRIEYYHNFTHVWVGGTMNSGVSPLDPVFYLHHNYIDNLWQQWEDTNSGNQSSSSLSGQEKLLVHYDGAPTSGSMLDSRNIPRPLSAGIGRNMDVWFAKSGKVILDGANGVPFIANDVTAPYNYRYTAATSTGSNAINGEIFVGDVKYDANNNVINDNKGGFEINSGVVCDFKAGKSIVFKSGFYSKKGSKTSAIIILAPNAARMRGISDYPNDENSMKIVKTIINTSPNPSNGIFKISLNEISEGKIEVSDLYGFTIYKTDFKNQNEFEMNLQDRPKGIYIVKVFSGEQVFTSKIIKN